MAYSVHNFEQGDVLYASQLNEMDAQIAENEENIENGVSSDMLAEDYSANKTYSIGDYVVYNNELYTCISEITAPEGWNSAHWETANLGDGISDLTRKINEDITPAIYSKGNDLTGVTTWNGFIINNDGTYTSKTGNSMKSFLVGDAEYVYVEASPIDSGKPIGGFYSANGVSSANLVELISSSGFVKVPAGGTYVILSYETTEGCTAIEAVETIASIGSELNSFETAVGDNLFPIGCTYEFGTINSTTGEETSSTQFVRSKETMECLEDIVLHFDIAKFYVVLYFYDSKDRYSNYTGYVTGTSCKLQKGTRFRIVLATNPLTANPDISVFKNTVKTQQWKDVLSAGGSETVITIGEDYNTLGEAITYLNGLTDQFSSYKIYIPNGTYNENTLTLTRRNVTIEGESENGVVIYVDGSQTTGSETNKHGLKIAGSGNVKNLTLKVDYVKYCVHQDGIGRSYDVFFENCTFIYGSSNEGYKHCIGVGARELENLYFENCAFVKLGAEADAGIYWHNDSGANNLSNKLSIKHSSFYNCGVLILQEIGSVDNVYDHISLEGIVTNSENYGVSISVPAGSVPSGKTADEVTYRICVNCDSKIPKLELTNRLESMYYQLAACAETVVVNT